MTLTATPPCPWKSTTEIGALYGRSSDCVWKWIRHGADSPAGRLRLNAKKIGGEWGITLEDVELYFDALGGDPIALAKVIQWKCNRELANNPTAETPAATGARARKDQDRARKALGAK